MGWGDISYRIGDEAGNTLLHLHNRQPAVTAQMDLGSPAVRTVTLDRPGADGTINETIYSGSRQIVWTGKILGSLTDRDAFIDDLEAVCHADARNYLYAKRPRWPRERRALVVAQSTSKPYVRDMTIVATWTGIEGALEDSVLSQVPIPTSATGTAFPVSNSTVLTNDLLLTDGPKFGLSFPVTFPVSFGSGSSNAAIRIENEGRTRSPFVARLYGPFGGAQLICPTIGLQARWPGLTIPAGSWIEFDTGNETSLIGGDVGAPAGFDIASSSWLWVPPGTSQWQMRFASFGDGARGEIDYRARW